MKVKSAPTFATAAVVQRHLDRMARESRLVPPSRVTGCPLEFLSGLTNRADLRGLSRVTTCTFVVPWTITEGDRPSDEWLTARSWELIEVHLRSVLKAGMHTEQLCFMVPATRVCVNAAREELRVTVALEVRGG